MLPPEAVLVRLSFLSMSLWYRCTARESRNVWVGWQQRCIGRPKTTTTLPLAHAMEMPGTAMVWAFLLYLYSSTAKTFQKPTQKRSHHGGETRP